MIPLNLLDAEDQSLKSISTTIGGLTITQVLDVEAGLKVVKDAVAAERERGRLTTNGGRETRREICIRPSTFNIMFNIAFGQDIDVVKDLLGQLFSTMLPIVLQPCRFVGPLLTVIKKGETVVLNMDTLVPSKDVTITALDANDADLSDPLPQTVTADSVTGLARVEMVVPSGYSDNKIKFKIDKKIVDLNEFGTHAAVTDDSEIHTLTVT